MFLVWVLCDDLCSLNDDVESLLEAMHIGSKPDDVLKIRITQDAISAPFTNKGSDAICRYFLPCGVSTFSKLFKGGPDWSLTKVVVRMVCN